MTNYKMILQYDGTRYSGWQKQGNTSNTIQGKLEAIASKLTGQPTDVNGSGRTDAGVHALRQIANFRGDFGNHGSSHGQSNSSHKSHHTWTPDQIRDAFNQALPMDIRVLEVTEAPPRFHARLNATQKHYRYYVDIGKAADVFRRRYASHLPNDYDISAMQRAAALLTGEHDFKSFCENKHMKKSTVRTIHRIDISQEKQMLIMDFYGNGFLYHMVRILAGTLLEIGNGTKKPEDIPVILDSKSRPAAGFTAPAQGLFLMDVSY